MLKTPGWEMSIVWYFFLGGIAGGAYFTAAIADNFAPAEDTTLVAHTVALPGNATVGVASTSRDSVYEMMTSSKHCTRSTRGAGGARRHSRNQ